MNVKTLNIAAALLLAAAPAAADRGFVVPFFGTANLYRDFVTPFDGEIRLTLIDGVDGTFSGSDVLSMGLYSDAPIPRGSAGSVTVTVLDGAPTSFAGMLYRDGGYAEVLLFGGSIAYWDDSWGGAPRTAQAALAFASPVPDPASWALLIAGLITFAPWRRIGAAWRSYLALVRMGSEGLTQADLAW